jgi:hypothetical protein
MLAVLVMSSGPAFPRTTAETASGHPITLPDAAQGRIAVLLVAFSKKAGEATAPWEDRLIRDYTSNPRLAVFRVAVLESIPALLRHFARGGIEQNVARERRDSFVLLFHLEDVWKQVVRFDTPDDAYVVLLDGAGSVRWHTRGRADSGEYESLRSQIDQLLALVPEADRKASRHGATGPRHRAALYHSVDPPPH